VLGDLRLGLVVPAYNEAERLDRLLPRIPRDLIDTIVVVDDASTDATADTACRHGAQVIRHEVRTGPGPAIRDGLDLLRRQGLGATAVMAANANTNRRSFLTC
jgi:glycosyltransferase involved in cell wall biosynthesis